MNGFLLLGALLFLELNAGAAGLPQPATDSARLVKCLAEQIQLSGDGKPVHPSATVPLDRIQTRHHEIFGRFLIRDLNEDRVRLMVNPSYSTLVKMNPHLSSTQEDAAEYFSISGETVNREMRGESWDIYSWPASSGHDKARTEEEHKVIRTISDLKQSIMNSPGTSQDIFVFRAESFGPNKGNKPTRVHGVGQEFHSASFISTSTDLSLAELDHGDDRKGINVIARIFVPKGQKALFFPGLPHPDRGYLSMESEVLLPDGLYFRVIESHAIGSKIYQDWDIVPSKAL